MGKRCIYGPLGQSHIQDDEAEIPEGWGVDPRIVAREKNAALIKKKVEATPITSDYKLMTDKFDLETYGRTIGIEIDKRKSVNNIKKDIYNGLQEKEEG